MSPKQYYRSRKFEIVYNQNGEKVHLPLGVAATAEELQEMAVLSAPFEANYPDNMHPLGRGLRSQQATVDAAEGPPDFRPETRYFRNSKRRALAGQPVRNVLSGSLMGYPTPPGAKSDEAAADAGDDVEAEAEATTQQLKSLSEIPPQLRSAAPPSIASSARFPRSRLSANGVSLGSDGGRARRSAAKSAPNDSSRHLVVAASAPDAEEIWRLAVGQEDARALEDADLLEDIVDEIGGGSGGGGGLPRLSHPHLQQTQATLLPSACGHRQLLGDICRACELRRQREGAPVNAADLDARRRQEKEKDRLLQQLAESKEKEKTLTEKTAQLGKRQATQGVSAFNQGIAEAAQRERLARQPRNQPPDAMHIFEARPLTPPRRVREAILGADLSRQIADRRAAVEQRSAEEARLGRIEAAQAVQAAQSDRERLMAERAERAEHYRRALSAQLRRRTSQLPARVPDSTAPVFGCGAEADVVLAEQQRRAAEVVAQGHVAAMEKKRREELLRRVAEQRRDAAAVRGALEDLIQDRAWRYQRAEHVGQRLRNDWVKAAQSKRDRELQEKLRRSSAGGLLHDQCAQFAPCRVCQRQLVNKGQSNVWRDTHFDAGSRYIV